MRSFLAVLLVATACARPAPPAAPAQEVDGTTAHRIARAGVLRAADLPGYRRDTTEASRYEGGSCLVQGTPPITEEYVSFDRGPDVVISVASVERSAAAAREEAEFMRRELAPCFERFATFALATSDVVVRKYRTAPFAVRVRGADTAVGYRVRMTVERDGRSGTLEAAVVAATTGYASLLLLAIAARDPVPSNARLTDLLGKVVARAAAAQR